MQRMIFTAAALLAALSVTPVQMGSQKMRKKSQAEQELFKLEREFGEAQPRRDISRLKRLMADDFIATVPPGKVINKAEVIAQVTSPDLEMESLVNDDIHVRVYGDVAVVTARGVARGRYKGRDASGQFRYTRVWIKQKGQWQAIAAQSTMIEER
jgi:ketosteroid isomerase-like protein